MKKFEYKITDIRPIFNEVVNKQKLTKLGDEGWELCVIKEGMGVFKRELLPEFNLSKMTAGWTNTALVKDNPK